MSEPKISRELLQQAERVFGDDETAAAWFYRPNLNLGGRRPLDTIEAGDSGPRRPDAGSDGTAGG